jgi:DNA-binding transcriptional regulator YdaS (Cro superfamily)
MVNKVRLKSTTTASLLGHSLYRGMQARVAARLGVSKSVVSQVASGQKKSQRIEKALLSEARRIERRIEKLRAAEGDAA